MTHHTAKELPQDLQVMSPAPASAHDAPTESSKETDHAFALGSNLFTSGALYDEHVEPSIRDATRHGYWRCQDRRRPCSRHGCQRRAPLRLGDPVLDALALREPDLSRYDQLVPPALTRDPGTPATVAEDDHDP
jgi:hypothetical protein